MQLKTIAKIKGMKMFHIEYDYLMQITEIISRNVKEARKKAGITQETAAKRCGITTHHYADIESGRRKPSVDLLFNLGIALGVGSADLLDSDEKPIPLVQSPRKAIEKFLSIPDEVVELAFKLSDPDAPEWEYAKAALENAIDRKQEEGGKANHS